MVLYPLIATMVILTIILYYISHHLKHYVNRVSAIILTTKLTITDFINHHPVFHIISKNATMWRVPRMALPLNHPFYFTRK